VAERVGEDGGREAEAVVCAAGETFRDHDEPVIGHVKTDGHLGRNFLKGRWAIERMQFSRPPDTTSAALYVVATSTCSG